MRQRVGYKEYADEFECSFGANLAYHEKSTPCRGLPAVIS